MPEKEVMQRVPMFKKKGNRNRGVSMETNEVVEARERLLRILEEYPDAETETELLSMTESDGRSEDVLALIKRAFP